MLWGTLKRVPLFFLFLLTYSRNHDIKNLSITLLNKQYCNKEMEMNTLEWIT